jgi:dynein heavy chain
LNCKDYEWVRLGKDPDNTINAPSTFNAPDPRANAGACLYNGKIYLFGGHGGQSYSRVPFNDLHSFDVETETWERIIPTNNPPDGRGGHSVFASNDRIYVYGGWNQEMQYNNILYFDLNTMEWTDPDIFNDVPIWNHSCVLVEAIPTWKFFIFGGEQAEYNEGSARSFGQYVNTSAYLDLGTMKWTKYASDPELFDNIPRPREYCAMSYTGLMQAESKDRRLIVYGGWNNGWFDDLYSLNVAKIVGPSYAIIASDPVCGQLTGNNMLRITGKGIRDSPKVYFTLGNVAVDTPGRQTIEVAGEFISSTELTCITPNFESFGPKECVI